MSFTDILRIPVIGAQFDVDNDADFFLYLSNETGRPQLYRKSLKDNTKEQQLTDWEKIIFEIRISPTKSFALISAESSGTETHHLFLIPLDGENTKPIQITNQELLTWAIAWSTDGSEIARTVGEGDKFWVEFIDSTSFKVLDKIELPYLPQSMEYQPKGNLIAVGGIGNTDILLLDRTKLKIKQNIHFTDISKEVNPVWSPDGTKIAIQTNLNEIHQWVLVNVETLEKVFLDTPDTEQAVEYIPCEWSPDSSVLYYEITKHSRCWIIPHKISGERGSVIPLPEGRLAWFKVRNYGQDIIAYQSSMTSPAALYQYNKSEKTVRRITPENFDNRMLSLLPKPQSVWYKSFDGKEIHAWYIPTANPDKSPKPALVFIHGGPTNQVYDEWGQGVYLQAMAQSGYGVLAINYRGSTGYGVEHLLANIGDIGGGDLEDVVYGAKWLGALPEVDAQRIGIIGASYGGYMSLYALVRKPEVFKIGCGLVPVTDWVENYKHLPANSTDSLFGCKPDENPELWKDRSPITHIKNIKSPVLIKAAVNDSRCPIQPIRDFVAILKEMDHPHQYIEVGDEGHNAGLVNRDERATDFMQIFQFLHKYL